MTNLNRRSASLAEVSAEVPHRLPTPHAEPPYDPVAAPPPHAAVETETADETVEAVEAGATGQAPGSGPVPPPGGARRVVRPVPAAVVPEPAVHGPVGVVPEVPDLSVQGTLALAFPLLPGAEPVPDRPAALHLVRPATAASAKGQTTVQSGQPAQQDAAEEAPGDLPALRPWATMIGQALVDVLAGGRPVGQLLSWTSERVYTKLAAKLAAEGRPGTDGPPDGERRPQARVVRICQPSPGVAEVTVTAEYAGRSRAAALRLEASGDRWQCTAIEVG